ncbi:MAG: FHA domain-containing protein, partial [Myxococcota bacterium]
MTSRPSPSVLQVYIFREGEFLGTDIFAEREVIVGRDPDEADLVLESGQVSRAHALITVNGNEITVEDQASTNGILVNDQRVESAKITRLDEITIGEFTLKLKLSGGKRGAKGRADDRTRAQPAQRSKAAKPAPAQRSGQPEHSRLDSSAPFDPNDLSDFDDIEPEDRESMRAGPEFRSRVGKVDNNQLGEMLEGMGLADESSRPNDNLADALEGD